MVSVVKWVTFILSVIILTGFIFLFLSNFNTKQTIVAVLGTGVDCHHPLLTGRTLTGYDFVQ